MNFSYNMTLEFEKNLFAVAITVINFGPLWNISWEKEPIVLQKMILIIDNILIIQLSGFKQALPPPPPQINKNFLDLNVSKALIGITQWSWVVWGKKFYMQNYHYLYHQLKKGNEIITENHLTGILNWWHRVSYTMPLSIGKMG